MKFRNLRIVWSVVCGLVSVLLVVLWVRSIWWVEGLIVPLTANQSLVIGSVVGTFALGMDSPSDEFFHQRRADEWEKSTQYASRGIPSFIWGGYFDEHDGIVIFIPDWFLVIFAAASGLIPWRSLFKWRFTLRTLLIATTLLAVVLGLAVWASR
jgi:hypothetical protein